MADEYSKPLHNREMSNPVEFPCEHLLLHLAIQKRTKELKSWLNGIPEGDTCSGLVKMKN